MSLERRFDSRGRVYIVKGNYRVLQASRNVTALYRNGKLTKSFSSWEEAVRFINNKN